MPYMVVCGVLLWAGKCDPLTGFASEDLLEKSCYRNSFPMIESGVSTDYYW